MSKQLLSEFYEICPGNVCVDLLTEEDKRYMKEGGLIVTGKLQEANKENGNGRVYSKEILEREMKNYEKIVNENRALGECVDEHTEIFTADGWKFIKDISDDEKIITLNEETRATEVQAINKKIVLDYNGIMYNITGPEIDMMLTPNHNMLLCDGDNQLFSMYAKQFIQLDRSNITIINYSYEHICLSTVKIEEVQHDGKVYCVNVQNGTWLMRRNGKIAWTKNCDHPDDSVVNLKNVSHMVTKIWWDGNSLMGKIKVLPTPSGNIIRSLVQSGVKLGISSRGLGSTRKEGGRTIVEDDFQLEEWAGQ